MNTNGIAAATAPYELAPPPPPVTPAAVALGHKVTSGPGVRPLQGRKFWPWIHYNAAPGAEQAMTDGLQVWFASGATNRAIVQISTMADVPMLARVRQRFTNQTILPAICTNPFLGQDGFDDPTRWASLIQACRRLVLEAGQGDLPKQTVLLDCEYALGLLLKGQRPFDLGRLAGLGWPTDIEVILYPGSASSYDQAEMLRCEMLAVALERALNHPQPIDIAMGDPYWPYWLPAAEAQRMMHRQFAKPPLHICWVGSWPIGDPNGHTYWTPETMATFYAQTAGSDVAIYPSAARWRTWAQTLAQSACAAQRVTPPGPTPT